MLKYIIYMHELLKVCNIKIHLFGETTPVFISDIFSYRIVEGSNLFCMIFENLARLTAPSWVYFGRLLDNSWSCPEYYSPRSLLTSHADLYFILTTVRLCKFQRVSQSPALQKWAWRILSVKCSRFQTPFLQSISPWTFYEGKQVSARKKI